MPTATKAASSNGSVSGTAFTNPTNAYTDDSSVATLTSTSKNVTVGTHDWGFAAFSTSDIPDGATIDAVRIIADVRLTVAGTGFLVGVQGAISNTANGGEVTEAGTTLTRKTSTMTGVTLANLRTAGVVEARIRYSRGNSSTSSTAEVEYVQIEVDYTVPPQTITPSGGITPAGALQLQTNKALQGFLRAFAFDDFSDTASSSWGDADAGGAWSVLSQGSAADFAKAGGVGTIQGAASRNTRAWLGSTSQRDLDVQIEVALDKVPAGGNAFAYLFARGAGSTLGTQDYYSLNLIVTTAGDVQAHIAQWIDGTETAITSAATVSGVGTYTAGMVLHLRLQCEGASPTTVRIRVWKDGDTEPMTWHQTTTDSTSGLQVAGFVAVGTYCSSALSNGPIAYSWDDLQGLTIPAGVSGALANESSGGGAWSATLLGSGLEDNTDSQTYTHPSVTVGAGKLILMFSHARGGGTYTGDPAIGGTLGLSWSKIVEGRSSGNVMQIWGALSGSGGSGTVSQDWTGINTQTNSGGGIILVEVGGADVSSTVAAAVIQTENEGSATPQTSNALDFPSAIDTANATFVYTEQRASAETMTPDTTNGFTELADLSMSSPLSTVEVQWKGGGFTGTAVTASWTTSAAWRQMGVEIKAAGGGPGPLNLSGGITPAGALTRQMQATKAGANTPAGALIRQAQARKAGSAGTPAGALLKQLQRRLTGASTPGPGALARLPQKALGGALTPPGALVKQAQARKAGALTPAGALGSIKALLRSYSGASTPGPGSLVRQTQKPLAGSGTPAGALAKQDQKRFTGGLTPAGAFSGIKALLRSYSGAVTPAGSVRRQVGKALTGSLASGAALRAAVSRRWSSTITPAGSVSRGAARGLVGALTPAGTVRRQAGKALAGALTPPGTLIRQTARRLAASVTPTGQFSTQGNATISKSGSIASAGGLRRDVAASKAGTLTPAGAVRQAVSIVRGGVLAPAGSLSKSLPRLFAGTITSAGSVLAVIVGLIAYPVRAVITMGAKVAGAISQDHRSGTVSASEKPRGTFDSNE